uniref:Secreted protein n=1 Tax=Glossina morsitans morsitans TaxID=37546 RepID=A0ABK9NG45_GLOMM
MRMWCLFFAFHFLQSNPWYKSKLNITFYKTNKFVYIFDIFLQFHELHMCIIYPHIFVTAAFISILNR